DGKTTQKNFCAGFNQLSHNSGRRYICYLLMTVTHFQRRPHPGQHSIERVFANVREELPADITCRVYVSRFKSRGVLRRFYNILEASLRQSDVNHVTGDVHFLALFLQRSMTLLTIHDCVSLERLSGVERQLLWFFWY